MVSRSLGASSRAHCLDVNCSGASRLLGGASDPEVGVGCRSSRTHCISCDSVLRGALFSCRFQGRNPVARLRLTGCLRRHGGSNCRRHYSLASKASLVAHGAAVLEHCRFDRHRICCHHRVSYWPARLVIDGAAARTAARLASNIHCSTRYRFPCFNLCSSGQA